MSSVEEEGSPASLQPTQHPNILPFCMGGCSQRTAAYALFHFLAYSTLHHFFISTMFMDLRRLHDYVNDFVNQLLFLAPEVSYGSSHSLCRSIQ